MALLWTVMDAFGCNGLVLHLVVMPVMFEMVVIGLRKYNCDEVDVIVDCEMGDKDDRFWPVSGEFSATV